MESLALLAAIIILSFWFTALASVCLTLLGFRLLGAIFGFLSCLAGIWLLFILPHAPFLGLINLFAGGFAIKRYIYRLNTKNGK